MSRKIKAGWIVMFIILSGGFLFSFGQKDDAKEMPVQNDSAEVPIQDDAKAAYVRNDSEEVSVQNDAPVDSGYYNTAVEGQEVIITGRVRLVGSDPFPRYVVTEAGKYDWYIPDAEDRKVISSFEQQTLTIRGTVVLREVILVNGRRIGIERNLKSVSLVE